MIRDLLIVCGLCILSLAACSKESHYTSDESHSDSETHWLQACTLDSDCPGELACLCNVCTVTCEDDNGCAAAGEGALCSRGQGEAVCGEVALSDQGGICLASCSSDDECSGAQVCAEGLCVARPEEPAPGPSEESVCQESGGRWDENACGHYVCGYTNFCTATIAGCDCGPERVFVEGQGCVVDEDCEDAGGGSTMEVCESSGGTWDENACGHYICGYTNFCTATIAGCDCGPERVFVEGQGCVVDEDCENEHDPRTLCVTTRGAWDEASCGHWVCGERPLCEAEEPGCNCGEGRTFVEGAGCSEDNTCAGAEIPRTLCVESNGRWDEDSCGHYTCGDVPDCDAVIPGCDCGEERNFVPGEGCVVSEECPSE